MYQLLTVKDIAGMLRCSVYQVYRLATKKKIPHMKVAGGAIRFDPTEIQHWLAKQKVELSA